jgi:hypothetical protein
MNKRNIQLALIILLAICFALLAYYDVFKSESEVPTPNNVATSTSAEKVEKNTEALSVSVAYPVIPGSSTNISRTNESIKSAIQLRIADFEKEAITSMDAGIDLPKDVTSTVTGSPGTEEKNERYVAIFMGMEWYLRGAAHPSHTIDTYIYDYKLDKLVKAPELFKQGSDYYGRLSTLSREDLFLQSRQGDMGFNYDESFVIDGTRPTAGNFARVLPLKDGLAIYFDEYQVAPYAAGPQHVVIPYAKLKDIINSDGVLGMYITK